MDIATIASQFAMSRVLNNALRCASFSTPKEIAPPSSFWGRMFSVDATGIKRAFIDNSKHVAIIKVTLVILACVSMGLVAIFNAAAIVTTVSVMLVVMLAVSCARWFNISMNTIIDKVSPPTHKVRCRLSRALTSDIKWYELFEIASLTASFMFMLSAPCDTLRIGVASLAFFTWMLFEKLALRSGYAISSGDTKLLHEYMFAGDAHEKTLVGTVSKLLVVFVPLWISIAWTVVWQRDEPTDLKRSNALIAGLFVTLLMLAYLLTR